MTEVVIETKGLAKHFGEIRAILNLTLTIRKGEMFSVVGPDGAGKTTAIRILCGILRPTSGTATILGYELGRDADKIKEHIGYLSQKFTLYGDLTVDENIEFFAEIHEVRSFRKRREELLEFTRLTPYRRRLAENLSGGMKQKLALACTLVHAPDILFLDEPTTGVDVVSRRDFWMILSGLLKSGITIVMTTPYLDEAERCSRVALMNKGELLAVDTPQNLRALGKGEVVEVVCGDIRRAVAIMKTVPGILDVQAFGDRLNVVVADFGRDFSSVRSRLQEEDIEIIQERRIPASLENVFIALTKPAKPLGENQEREGAISE